MPLLKRKPFPLTPRPRDLTSTEKVFCIPFTGEVFRTYEYAKPMLIVVYIESETTLVNLKHTVNVFGAAASQVDRISRMRKLW